MGKYIDGANKIYLSGNPNIEKAVELYHMALYGNDKQTAAYQLCIIYFDYEGKYSSLDYVNIVLNGNNIKEKKEISLAILNSLYKYNIDEYSKLCLYIKALGCLLEIGEEQLIQYDIFKKLDLVFKQNRSKVSEQTIEEIKCLKEKFQNDEYKKSITNLYYKCIEYVYNRKIIEYDDSSYYEVIELLMNKYHNDKKVLDLIRQYESDLVRKYSSDNYDKTIECLTKLEKVDSSIASKKEKYILNHQKKLAIEVYFSEMRTNNADECIKEVQKTSLYKYLVRDKDALELNKRLNRASVYRYFNIANSQSCQYGCPYDKQCEKAKWYYYIFYDIFHFLYSSHNNTILLFHIAYHMDSHIDMIENWLY